MNQTLILLGGLVVVAGRWTQKKPFDMPAVVAVFFLALMIAALSEMDEELGRGFAILFVVTVTYVYGRDIAKTIGKAVQ